MSSTPSPPTRDYLQSSQSKVIQNASYNAFKDALPVLLFTTLSVLTLTKKSPMFAKSTGPSSRTAIAIMPPFFVWGLTSEHEVIRGKREASWDAHYGGNEGIGKGKESKNVIQVDKNYVPPKPSHISASEYLSEFGTVVQIVPSLSLRHKLSNFVSSNPFEVLLGLGVPFAVGALRVQSRNREIKPSQMIMHARVIGQAGALTLLLTLMGFKAAADYWGRYITQEEADDMVEEERRRRGKWVEDMERNARMEMERREGSIKVMKEMVKEKREGKKRAKEEGKGKGDLK
mmetsp:Transcript_12872/g.26277  ORF Transcript_12872/g.26277 Transcript_12872/m.26277 type:complete len:288 (-) Transcript_12872:74-937(-)